MIGGSMKANWRMLVLAAMALLLPAAAQQATQPTNPVAPSPQTIRDRQINQQKRIAEGVKNGSLTANETKNLEKREAVTNKLIRNAASDGRLTTSERVRINAVQRANSRAIAHQKHDRQRRRH